MLDETQRELISTAAGTELDAWFAARAGRLARRRESSVKRQKMNEALLRLLPEAEREELLGGRRQPDDAEMFRDLAGATQRARRAVPELTIEDQPVGDNGIQFLSPPYVGAWHGTTGSGRVQVDANADVSGNFGISMLTFDGHTTASASVMAQYIPDGPARYVQIRPFVRYGYQYLNDNQDLPYSSSSEARFAINILTLNDVLEFRTEPGFPWSYSQWDQDTGWFAEDDDSGGGYAYALGGYPPPLLKVEPGQVYLIVVMCFGDCDAGGGFIGRAMASGSISAQLPFIIISDM